MTVMVGEWHVREQAQSHKSAGKKPQTFVQKAGIPLRFPSVPTMKVFKLLALLSLPTGVTAHCGHGGPSKTKCSGCPPTYNDLGIIIFLNGSYYSSFCEDVVNDLT